MVEIFDLELDRKRSRRVEARPSFTNFFDQNQEFDKDITKPFFEGLMDLEVDPFKGTVRRSKRG